MLGECYSKVLWVCRRCFGWKATLRRRNGREKGLIGRFLVVNWSCSFAICPDPSLKRRRSYFWPQSFMQQFIERVRKETSHTGSVLFSRERPRRIFYVFWKFKQLRVRETTHDASTPFGRAASSPSRIRIAKIFS